MNEDKRNIFYIEELENLEWDEIFLDLLKEHSQTGLRSRLKGVCCRKPKAETGKIKRALLCLCCFSWCARFIRGAGMSPKEKA